LFQPEIILTSRCSDSRLVLLTFLVPAHPGSPGQRAVCMLQRKVTLLLPPTEELWLAPDLSCTLQWAERFYPVLSCAHCCYHPLHSIGNRPHNKQDERCKHCKFRNFYGKFLEFSCINKTTSIDMTRWSTKFKTDLHRLLGNGWLIAILFSYDEFVGFYFRFTVYGVTRYK